MDDEERDVLPRGYFPVTPGVLKYIMRGNEEDMGRDEGRETRVYRAQGEGQTTRKGSTTRTSQQSFNST